MKAALLAAGAESVGPLEARTREPHWGRKFGDGSRYDPAGLGLHPPRPAPQKADAKEQEKWWADLRQAGARDTFGYTVAAEPGRKRPPTTWGIVVTKMKFIYQELFMDLGADVRAADYAASKDVSFVWAKVRRTIAGGDADLPATAAKVLTGGTTTRSRKRLDAASEQQVVYERVLESPWLVALSELGDASRSCWRTSTC